MKEFIKRNYELIVCIAVVIVVSVLGSIFVNMGMGWFDGLKKPTEWIPNFVIPVVWTVVYLLFTIIFCVLLKKNLINRKLTVVSILNGVFNILWCLVFFTSNQLLLGMVIIVINLILAIFLMLNLIKTEKWYVDLLWIYPIWLTIATTLNLVVWTLN